MIIWQAESSLVASSSVADDEAALALKVEPNLGISAHRFATLLDRLAKEGAVRVDLSGDLCPSDPSPCSCYAKHKAKSQLLHPVFPCQLRQDRRASLTTNEPEGPLSTGRPPSTASVAWRSATSGVLTSMKLSSPSAAPSSALI